MYEVFPPLTGQDNQGFSRIKSDPISSDFTSQTHQVLRLKHAEEITTTSFDATEEAAGLCKT